jgi:hypothetical protein
MYMYRCIHMCTLALLFSYLRTYLQRCCFRGCLDIIISCRNICIYSKQREEKREEYLIFTHYYELYVKLLLYTHCEISLVVSS